MVQDKRAALRNGMKAEQFLEALIRTDKFWASERKGQSPYFSVFDANFGWVKTISVCGDLAKREDPLNLSDDERKMILGLNDIMGAWGLLGSMRAAGRAKAIFAANTDRRQNVLSRIWGIITPVIKAATNQEGKSASVVAMNELCAIAGIKVGVASRILTLIRPDVCVSVNRGSIFGLAQIDGLDMTEAHLANYRNYSELLMWVASQPWYIAGSEAFISKIDRGEDAWRMRAALIDCFVYNPT